MKGENPFQPVLAKPIDDTVFNNDPAADNFLVGNDGFNRTSSAMNSFARPNNYRPVRLDQMAESNPFEDTDNSGSLGAKTPQATKPAKNSKGGIFSGISRGKKTVTPAQTQIATPNSGAGLNSASNFGQGSNLNNVTSGFGATQPSSASAAAAKPTSPISSALADAAAISDSKSPLVTGNANAKDSKVESAKSPKGASTGRQLTISTMTIVFAVLFVVATGVAIYFGLQNKKNVDALADARAQVSELTDNDNSAKSANTKSTTQLSALQDKVQDLTKKTEDNQKTIDDLNKKNNDLTKSNTDLQNQLKAANDKLASDKSVSENMKSLLTAMCTSAPFNTSAACQAANGVVQSANQSAASSVANNQ